MSLSYTHNFTLLFYLFFFFFFFNDTATTEIYTLSLHDALPISIALTHFACCAAHSGPIFHMVTHAMDQGVAKMTAATVLSLSGLASVVGRIATGMIADRVGAKPTLITGLALQAVVVALYLFAHDAS